ncbi:MAG: DUF6249 domain-containing protein [Salibacteraceae bacterium]
MEEVLIPLIVFGTFFGIAYLYFTTRNRERMAMIERGQSASIFDRNKKFKLQSWTLRIGVLAIGISVGILLGSIVSNTGIVDEEAAFPAMIFLFGGAGLVVSYFLERKLQKEDD